jgi:hypothetical protein
MFTYLLIDLSATCQHFVVLKLDDLNLINTNIKYQNKLTIVMCPLMICQHIIPMLAHCSLCSCIIVGMI